MNLSKFRLLEKSFRYDKSHLKYQQARDKECSRVSADVRDKDDMNEAFKPDGWDEIGAKLVILDGCNRAIINLSPHLWRKELLLQRHQSQQHPLPLQLVLLPGSRQGTSSTGPKADAALQLQWHQRRPAVRAVGAAEKANVAEKSFKACISMTIEFFFSNVLPLFSNPSPTFLQSPYKFI